MKTGKLQHDLVNMVKIGDEWIEFDFQNDSYSFEEENQQLDLVYLGCSLTWIREGLPVGKLTKYVWRHRDRLNSFPSKILK